MIVITWVRYFNVEIRKALTDANANVANQVLSLTIKENVSVYGAVLVTKLDFAGNATVSVFLILTHISAAPILQ